MDSSGQVFRMHDPTSANESQVIHNLLVLCFVKTVRGFGFGKLFRVGGYTAGIRSRDIYLVESRNFFQAADNQLNSQTASIQDHYPRALGSPSHCWHSSLRIRVLQTFISNHGCPVSNGSRLIRFHRQWQMLADRCYNLAVLNPNGASTTIWLVQGKMRNLWRESGL